MKWAKAFPFLLLLAALTVASARAEIVSLPLSIRGFPYELTIVKGDLSGDGAGRAQLRDAQEFLIGQYQERGTLGATPEESRALAEQLRTTESMLDGRSSVLILRKKGETRIEGMIRVAFRAEDMPLPLEKRLLSRGLERPLSETFGPSIAEVKNLAIRKDAPRETFAHLTRILKKEIRERAGPPITDLLIETDPQGLRRLYMGMGFKDHLLLEKDPDNASKGLAIMRLRASEMDRPGMRLSPYPEGAARPRVPPRVREAASIDCSRAYAELLGKL